MDREQFLRDAIQSFLSSGLPPAQMGPWLDELMGMGYTSNEIWATANNRISPSDWTDVTNASPIYRQSLQGGGPAAPVPLGTAPPVFDLAADTAATQEGPSVPPPVPPGSTLPDVTGGAGGNPSATGVPQAGNGTTGSQTAPASSAGTGGNTAPGAGEAGQGQGSFLGTGTPNPANPADQSWMGGFKGSGGLLTGFSAPTVANSAFSNVTNMQGRVATPFQTKRGMLSV
jgi:hypothetical protein